MRQTFILLLSCIFVSAYGAPQLSPYYAPQTINPSSQYVLLYPQYQRYPQYVVPREGEEGGGGGGFWQSVINYFGSCGGEGGGGERAYFRRIIPPPTVEEETKVPGSDNEKQGATEKEDGIDRKPAKPFYYILPPSPGFNYYYPQPNLFNQPSFLPNYIESNSFRAQNGKSINDQVISQNDENNKENVKMSNGHANEKNVN